MHTILVVDDTREITNVIARFIARDDRSVIFAYSGEEALKKVEGRTIDLVITDFYMPMGGLEMIAALKEDQEQSFKTILISGSGIIDNPALQSAMGTLGIQKTFTKPIDFPKLLEAVDTLLT